MTPRTLPAATRHLPRTALPLASDVQLTPDPSIARDGNTVYIFATGKAPEDSQFPIRCSEARRRCQRSAMIVP